MSNLTTNDTQLFVGIDVGSTTTKIVAINPEKHEILLSNYKRHNAAQAQSVQDALAFFEDKFPNARIRLALTGSGAKHLAEALGCCYIQEVVANSIALQKEYDNVGTAIELGGQDAKMIFFRRDPATQTLNVADMRMNGSCAGGTGAFIDEIASILKVPVEEFNELASQGSCIYDISGRCGVYAKTDIQPLLNQGISRQDLALSSFHAIAKQTIGGLAQGLDIQKPVVFEGGPLTFNPTLVNVFAKRLGLTPEETLRPTHPEIMIAYGAALSLDGMFAGNSSWYMPKHYLDLLENPELRAHLQASSDGPLFFESEEEHRAFNERHQLPEFTPYVPQKGETVHAYLGIDSGSTTTKFVLMDEDENILDSFYAPNEGDPLTVAKTALLTIHDRYEKAGAKLDIIAAGTTGYGELLFSKAFSTECHVVETVAHARAADKYIKGKVISSDRQGNIYKSLYIYDGTAAIELKLYNGLYLDYLLDLDKMESQWVYVRLDGLYLGNYRMMLSIGGAPSDGINTAGTHKYYANSNLDNPRVAKLNVFPGEYVKLEASDILEVNSSNYTTALGEDQLGRLVRFNGVKIRYAGIPNQDDVTNPPMLNGTFENPYPTWIVTDWGSPRYGAWYRWAYNVNNVRLYGSVLMCYNETETNTANPGVYGIRTSGYSQFAMKPIPKDGAVGNVLGIYGVYGQKWDQAQFQISASRIEDLDFKPEDLLTEAQIERMTPASSYEPPVKNGGDDYTGE